MKALHKLIVSSATYRQSSAAPASLAERDPYNRLLARGPRFRMEAEMVRDGVLAASGLLSRKIGGPSVFPPQPDGIWDIPYSNEKWIGSDRGGSVPARALRVHPPLGRVSELHDVRCDQPRACTVRRVRTNTPLQALTTLNDEAFFEAARALAATRPAGTLPRPRTSGSGHLQLSGSSCRARPNRTKSSASCSLHATLERFRK